MSRKNALTYYLLFRQAIAANQYMFSATFHLATIEHRSGNPAETSGFFEKANAIGNEKLLQVEDGIALLPIGVVARRRIHHDVPWFPRHLGVVPARADSPWGTSLA